MTDTGSDDCLVCGELSGRVAVPGGLLVSSPTVDAFHLPPLRESSVYAGHLLVVPRRHVPDFAHTTDEEAAGMGVAVAELSRRLQAVGATRVYTATVGHDVDHLHVHLLPRWPGTPPDVAWHAVDEWPDAGRLDADGIVGFCRRLRA